MANHKVVNKARESTNEVLSENCLLRTKKLHCERPFLKETKVNIVPATGNTIKRNSSKNIWLKENSQLQEKERR